MLTLQTVVPWGKGWDLKLKNYDTEWKFILYIELSHFRLTCHWKPRKLFSYNWGILLTLEWTQLIRHYDFLSIFVVIPYHVLAVKVVKLLRLFLPLIITGELTTFVSELTERKNQLPFQTSLHPGQQKWKKKCKWMARWSAKPQLGFQPGHGSKGASEEP